MKLYTRLIEEGTFIFWSSDGPDTSFNLKISIAVGEDNVVLVNTTPDADKNYYVFDHVGSGEYLIELNAYRGEKLYQTETKSIKIISSTQTAEEHFQALVGELGKLKVYIATVNSNITTVNSNIEDLYNLVHNFKAALTEPENIVSIRKAVDYYEKHDW